MDLTGLGDLASNLYKTIREDRDLEKWWRFTASFGVTTAIVFPFVYGTAVLAGTPIAKAVAAACVATSGCLFALYRNSPLSKSLMIEVPKDLVEQSQEHPDEVLIAGKDAEKK